MLTSKHLWPQNVIGNSTSVLIWLVLEYIRVRMQLGKVTIIALDVDSWNRFSVDEAVSRGGYAEDIMRFMP